MAIIDAVPQWLEMIVAISLIQAAYYSEGVGKDIKHACQFNQEDLNDENTIFGVAGFIILCKYPIVVTF